MDDLSWITWMRFVPPFHFNIGIGVPLSLFGGSIR